MDELKAKIENIYIMFLYSIMKEDINRVKQYLSDDLVEQYKNIIDENIANNIVQKFGELNVSSVEILNINNDIITASIIAKYIDYKIDRNTRKFVSGDKKRTRYQMILKIKQQLNNKNDVYVCSSCGAALNINLTGVCEYCKEPVDDSESVYVIQSIEGRAL